MRFESEWPGDNVAPPVCDTYDREDALLDRLGCGSNRIDTRWDGVDPIPTALAPRDWHDTAVAAPTKFEGWRRRVGSIAAIVAGVVVESAPRTRELPYPSGLEGDRRPNPGGHRNFPHRVRVCERRTARKLTVMRYAAHRPVLISVARGREGAWRCCW